MRRAAAKWPASRATDFEAFNEIFLVISPFGRVARNERGGQSPFETLIAVSIGAPANPLPGLRARPLPEGEVT